MRRAITTISAIAMLLVFSSTVHGADLVNTKSDLHSSNSGNALDPDLNKTKSYLHNSSSVDARAPDLNKTKSGSNNTTKMEQPIQESEVQNSISKAAADAIQTMNAQPIPTQLAGLETDAFSHAYKSDTNEERLCRLEHFVFGKQLTGDATTRLKKLTSALQPKNKSFVTGPAAQLANGSLTGTDSNGANEGPGPNRASLNSTNSNERSLSTGDATSASSDGAALQANSSAPHAPPAPTKTKVSVIEVINRGIDNYNQHRYSNADEDFEESCAMAPGMARCYSYLAITKLQLNLRQAAIDAFRMSTMLDPFGTYGRYARSCLIVLAGDEAMRKRPPVDSRKILDTAMTNIDKQSSDIASRHRSQAELIANSRMSYRPGISFVDSGIESNSARTDGALRAAHAAESANNLKHMLAVKKMPGDANLRAWGTTLTTRYYGNETYLNPPYYIPKERPMELRAIVQSLNSKHFTTTAIHAPHTTKYPHPNSKHSAAQKKNNTHTTHK